MLLPTEVNIISEKQSCKKDTLVTYSIGCIKIILKLLTKVVTLYMQAFIVQVGIFGLKKLVLECKSCLSIFQTFNKQF